MAAGVAPAEVVWSDPRMPAVFGVCSDGEHGAGRGLFAAHEGSGPTAGNGAPRPESPTSDPEAPLSAPRELRIPRALLELLEHLSLYRNPGRWDLMYRLTWRVLNENRSLLEN